MVTSTLFPCPYIVPIVLPIFEPRPVVVQYVVQVCEIRVLLAPVSPGRKNAGLFALVRSIWVVGRERPILRHRHLLDGLVQVAHPFPTTDVPWGGSGGEKITGNDVIRGGTRSSSPGYGGKNRAMCANVRAYRAQQRF